MHSCIAIFFNSWTIIMNNDIIAYNRVIIHHSTWSITGTYNNPTSPICKYQVISNSYSICGMPEMYAPSSIAIGDIIVNMSKQIGLINPMNGIANGERSNVMDDI